MTMRKLIAASSLLLVGLAGCGSGDINIDPSTNVTNSNNTTNNGGNGGNGGTTNPCASYLNQSGQTIQGTYDGTNCTYSAAFVDSGNPLTADLTIPDLPNNGAHVFQGSLFFGRNFTSLAAATAAGITQGGDGPALTIEAGATLAFSNNTKFMVINRGAQVFAVGTADAPITITSLSDVGGTLPDPLAVQQWGGLVINGFGVTNQCEYTGIRDDDDNTPALALTGECSVPSEGSAGLDENHYGGVNDDDSSGRLEYVIVKHTGATVGNGDELNGITFGAVGRNTIVRNVQVYSVYDDGFEFFGGAVNVENFIGTYVRDDSLDIDEGYAGTITNALIIQQQNDGNHCVEADGIADFSGLDAPTVDDRITRLLNSRPTINHMTCIFSAGGTGTHAPSAGLILHEGIFATINDALVIGSFGANDTGSATNNYCLRMNDARTQQAAVDDDLQLNSVIFSCAERSGATFTGIIDSEENLAEAQGNVFADVTSGQALSPVASAGSGLALLEGTPPLFSVAFASMQVNGAAAAASVTPTDGNRPFLGALSTAESDWTAPWAFGLRADNQAVPLWFAP